jgi:peptidoglycan/xylan/chitin deacetylase (PgdA/CDA1 family)
MAAFLIILSSLIVLILFWYLNNTGNTLRVLMYHKVSAHKAERLTITQQQLQQQISWLIKNNYNIISFKEFKQIENEGFAQKSRYVILTFDDAYENNLVYALPLLKQYNTKATIFIPTAFIGSINSWDNGNDKIMTALQLQQLPPQHIELALHTHTHVNFKPGISEVIKEEMLQSVETLQQLNIPFVPVFAYAYGAHPKEKAAEKNMFNIFFSMNIWYALKIGNSINHLPLKKKYLVKRIDVRGTESFFTFRLKMWFGKIRL